MLGLRDYGSSDEEEDAQVVMKENGDTTKLASSNAIHQNIPSISQDLAPNNGPVLGPALGPASDPMDSSPQAGDVTSSPPSSPYTAERQVIHSLTLPPIPNLAIPPSPPGSPRPSTSAKISRFLELKSQDVHFNAKLASSSALRNPSLLQNLMSFAGIDEEHGQYASTLPPDLAPIPKGGFPKWAYAEELAKSQQEILKRKETERTAGRREAVEFVAASETSTAIGTPQSAVRSNVKGSAAERVMAGLGREKSRSPHVLNGGGGRDADQRRSRFDDRAGRIRSRSRSPKRRRDR